MSSSRSKGVAWPIAFLFCCVSASATDVKQVPLWDGETSVVPDGPLVNRYGGPVVHLGETRTVVSRITTGVRTGRGAYRVDVNKPAGTFAFFQLALSGFGPSDAYVMSRNLARFDSLCFWYFNDTGAEFTLKLEIKDARNSADYLQSRNYQVASSSTWTQACAPLQTTAGWTKGIIGFADLQRAKLIGFVFEPGVALLGDVRFDDVTLVEAGGPLESATASPTVLGEHIFRRHFFALWDSRSPVHGLVPLNSVFADVAALNSTAGLVKLLPLAISRGWISRVEADAYVDALLPTFHTLMDQATYLPARYVDWLTLDASHGREESPVDAAFVALALYDYRVRLASLPLRTRIDDLLSRFNFGAFLSDAGWKLAYRYDPPAGFTNGVYDGYSTEIYVISLAAHLMKTNRVDIRTAYYSGIKRKKALCSGQGVASVVHSDPGFRAPFTQWLFSLFVDVRALPIDAYPVPVLATNPWRNAVAYQQDAHREFFRRGRGLMLQPDAGDDGSGEKYEQFSCHNDFGRPGVFHPWSVMFSMLAEPNVAEPAFREYLSVGLHGPLGLSDSVDWATGAVAPGSITARHDFWNVSLGALAMAVWLFRDNEPLTGIAEVSSALSAVYPNPTTSLPPIPGDFDGDIRTDLTVWRPGDGTWYWLRSSNGYSTPGFGKQWGALGDVPLAGDMDGDGRADLIVWRASSGTWYWLTSSSGYDYAFQQSKQWGNHSLGDVPMLGEMDGDGKADLIVWRASTGTWHWLLSTSTYDYAYQDQKQWGNQSLGDSPLPGDFDGDGLVDLTVWRAVGGEWHWLPSSSAYDYQSARAKQWGSQAHGDRPVGGDVDGDGRSDIIVWRASTGTWHWLTSTCEYDYGCQGSVQWGANGDVPTGGWSSATKISALPPRTVTSTSGRDKR